MSRRPRSIGAASLLVCLLVTGLWAPATSRAATIISVPGDYPTIQAAIDAAADGDTIRVSPGTYGERVDTLSKRITLESVSGAAATTIDAGGYGTAVKMDAGPGETPVLRGFTIKGGGGPGDGGGVIVTGGPALIEDNWIVDNTGCIAAGVAAYASEATIRDNRIASNTQWCADGGGIFIGAAGTVQVVGNTIEDNSSGSGGGIGMNAAGAPVIVGNIIRRNHATGEGGGLSLGNHSDATITNNLIVDNEAFRGGAMAALVPMGTIGPTMVNNTIAGNTASEGAAVYLSGFHAGSRFANNLIVGATTQATIECTGLYDPTPPIFDHNDIFNATGPELSAACGTPIGTNGNVSFDPGLIDPTAGDYHLRADSPLIDAGTNTGAPTTDIDGDARPHDGDESGSAVVDIGFDEAIDPILIDPPAVRFTDTGVAVQGAPVALAVTNLGSSGASITSAALSGPNVADISITADTCSGHSIPVGSACAITLRFTPAELGERTAALTVTGPSPMGTRVVELSGRGIVPVSGVVWGGTAFAGPAYTWNAGNALGTTTQSGAQRLHLAYATHRIGSKWAADAGPYAGIYYTRAVSGATWSTPVRVNPTTQHAERVGLAASGSRVYVTWVTQTKVARYSGTAPRVLYVRTNTSHGTSTAWKAAIRLTGTTGRVDYPTIAATGSDVHVAWTDAVAGTIKVATSRNAGTTWTTRSIGTATTLTTDGRSGVPSVAAFGATVAVVWIADPAGTIKGRVSLDHGATWGPLETVGVTPLGFASVAVRGNRIAVAWSTLDDVVVRLRVAGTWGAPMAIASLAPGGDPVPYAPMIVLQDPDRIGVAWSEELDAASRSNLRWTESTDGGATWYQTQTIATTSTTRRYNDWASVIWPTSGARSVVWNGWAANTSSFRLFFRKGTGTPTGVAVSATEWTPDAEPGLSPDGTERVPGGPGRGPARVVR